jgi:hypothetical protein
MKNEMAIAIKSVGTALKTRLSTKRFIEILRQGAQAPRDARATGVKSDQKE